MDSIILKPADSCYTTLHVNGSMIEFRKGFSILMRNFLKPFSFLPALILMYMIYSFSAQEAEVSSALSYKFSYTIIKAADKVLDAGLEEWEMQKLATRFNGVTRKLAHMTEYFALAVAVSFPLYVYGLHGILLMLLAGIICVGFACGDEYHQSFVAGRAPSTRDVLIDSFGVFWGIILVRIIGWTGRKTIFRPGRKKKRRDDSYYEEDDKSKRRSKQMKYAGDEEYYEGSYDSPPRREYEYDSYERAPQAGCCEDSRRRNSQQDYYEGSRRRNTQQDYYEDYRNHARPQYYYSSSRDHNPETMHDDSYYAHTYSHREVQEAHVSDKLSEDMSFKKLMHDIKEQRKEGKHNS